MISDACVSSLKEFSIIGTPHDKASRAVIPYVSLSQVEKYVPNFDRLYIT